MKVTFPLEILGNEPQQNRWITIFRAGYASLMPGSGSNDAVREQWPEAYDAGVSQAWKDHR